MFRLDWNPYEILIKLEMAKIIRKARGKLRRMAGIVRSGVCKFKKQGRDR